MEKNNDHTAIINITYAVNIEVAKPPGFAFNHLIRLSKWWVEEFIGEELMLNSEFVLKIGDTHFSKNKVIEFVQDKKFSWISTESNRSSDNFDWTGTKMIFELDPVNNGTQITFTYDGVVFESEQERLKEICDYCIKDLLYKHLESFTVTIEISKSSQEVYKCLAEVSNWWSKDFEGSSTKLNDEFIINHPAQHYSKQKLVEVVPNKKIVWLVTDSTLHWLKKNKQEWTNTKMVFEIGTEGNKTVLRFTHEGLIPELECYAMCKNGWTMIIKDWLYQFITTGTPSAEMTRAAEMRNQVLDEKNKMDSANYHRTIVVNASPAEAMKKISAVNNWWKRDFSGSAENLNDKFTVPFGDFNGEKSFVDFVVNEFVPNKKTVWKVTDCNLPWFKDKKEWNNTEVVFECSSENDKTKIDFTHIGLVPGIECYEACEKGWDGHVTNSLVKLINEGKGNPQ